MPNILRGMFGVLSLFNLLLDISNHRILHLKVKWLSYNSSIFDRFV